MNFFYSFDKINDIKFLQKKIFSHKNQSSFLTLTPYGVGNSLGACAWRLECNLINILYLVAYNNYNEVHLDGVNLSQFTK